MRWTTKEKTPLGDVYDFANYPLDEFDIIAIARKLGKLEDIEEKFKVDLSVMFKAMKNGINTMDGYVPPHDLVVWEGQLYRKPMGQPFHTDMFPFWKYGEDWALTKEELEESK